MADDDPLALDLAEAVLDGRPMDWAAAASGKSESQRGLIAQFQAVAGIASFGLTSSPSGHQGGGGEGVEAPREPLTWGPLAILGRIGRGSFGDVYRARDPKLDRPVALKLLRHRDHSGDEDESAAIDEGRLMARIRHPNVVTVYGAERIEGRVGIWMQFVDGRPLNQEVAERGPLGEEEVARIGRDLCGALAAIHKAGLLHRDLKAQNVLRDADGQILITDFGAGCAVSDVSEGATEVTGTPLYLAPEVLAGGAATLSSDVYSLGVLLFYLATGRYPVSGGSVAEIREAHRLGRRTRLREVRPDLTERFVTAVECALKSDPTARFANAALMGEALTPRAAARVRRTWAAALILALAGASAALVVGRPWRGRDFLSSPPSAMVARQLNSAEWVIWGGPSADGRLFSFTNEKGNLCVLDLATGVSRQITDDADSDRGQQAESSVFSKDGRFAATTWHRQDGGYEMRLVDVEAATSRVLMTRGTVDVPVPIEWARDGESVLSILIRADHSAQIALVSAADGAIQKVKDLGPVIPQRVSLSPDGQFVVYDHPQSPHASARDIFIVRRDGSDERRLVEFPAHDVDAAWTPDGSHVVFASDRSGEMDLWSLAVKDGFAEGVPDVLRRNIGRASLLGLTDTGTYYYGQTVGAVDVYEASLDRDSLNNSRPVAATYSGSNISSLWSPDGRLLAYTSRRGPVGFSEGWTALVIRDQRTQEQRELMPAMNSFLLRSWSPDGRSVLVQGQDPQGRTGAHAIDAETGLVSPIVLNQGPSQNNIRRPDWRKDGRVVYINSGTGRLLSREVASAREDLLLDFRKEGVTVAAHIFGRGYRLSPDGQTLAYTVNERHGETLLASLWVRPLQGGRPRLLVPAKPTELLLFQDWTPDGTTLLFTRWLPNPREPVSLWRVSVQGGEPEAVGLTREGLRDVSVHPDGTRITFTAGWPRGEVWGLENLLPPRRP